VAEGLPEVPEVGRKRSVPPPPPSLFDQLSLDLDFLPRVYRTCVIVLAILGMILWAKLSPAAGLGFAAGGVLSLVMLWGMEVTVRALIKPGSRSAKGLIGVMVGKLLLATVVLILCLMAALRGWINLIWLLAGFAMPHSVVMLKLLGQQIRKVYADMEVKS
jgi:hypothetical protein